MARDRIRLGEWVIPKHHAVIASITMAHQSEQNFPDAKTFNPDRFLGGNPDTHTWIPFGGGIRREFEFGTQVCRGRAESLPRCRHRARTWRPDRCQVCAFDDVSVHVSMRALSPAARW